MRTRLASIVEQRRGDDRGVVAGSDMLIFGVLAFVLGSLLVLNVWAVIDASLAVSAASREGARTYVEADPATAWADTQVRMNEVMTDYGRSDRAVAPSPPLVGAYERCAVVTVTAAYDVALVSLPIFGDFGSLKRVEASHTERIDAYRSGDFGGSC